MNLKEEASKLGIEISENAIENLDKYAELLVEYNKVMNLTAITEREEIDEKHFLDSLTLLLSDKLFDGCKMIDIGAGAGFPSLPIKIAREDIDVTMLDSLNKRVGFLNTVIESLNLDKIKAIHSRAEDAGKAKEHRESYDIATARAVAELCVLSELALPFVKVGGYFVAMKGNSPSNEIDRAKPAISKLGGKLREVKEITLPSGIKHTIVIMEKISKTPPAYPRKAGKPSKEPLL